MKKLIFIFILFFVFGCSNNKEKTEKSEYEQLKEVLPVSVLAYPDSVLFDENTVNINSKETKVYTILTQKQEIYENIINYYRSLKDLEISDLLEFETEEYNGVIYIDPNPSEDLEYKIIINFQEKTVE